MPSELLPLPTAQGLARPSPGRQRLSTANVEVRDRFAYWTDMVCAVYARLECDPLETPDIVGEIAFSELGALHLTEVHSSVRRLRRTPSLIGADARDACLVQIQRAGRARVSQDGREATLSAGDFVLYDTARPYELNFDGPTHEVVVFRLPRAALAAQVSNLEDLTATAVPGTCTAGHLLRTMVERLQSDMDELAPSAAVNFSEAIVSMIAAGLRSLPGASARGTSSLTAFHIARVRQYVTDHLRDPALNVGRIAEALGMSPDHLSRLFRTEPVPLSRMIWQQRLDACRRELSDPRCAGRHVSDIAFAWGFNDATHFGRTFKAQFGLGPREWRQEALARGMRPEPRTHRPTLPLQ